MFGLGEIASLVGIGGQLLGGIGGGKAKAPTSVSGFASLGGDQKDYANTKVWDSITSLFESPYRRVPLRRINESDTNPLFGSRARQDIQGYKDALAAMIAANPGSTAAAEEDVGGIEARMMARQFLEGGGGQAPKYADKTRDMYRAGLYDNAGLATIGKYLMSNQGKPHNYKSDDYSKFAAALGVNPTLEGAKRKGLA